MSFKKVAKCIGIVAVLLIGIAVFSALAYRQYLRHRTAQLRAISSPQGIDSLKLVSIGGINQWIEVRGQSAQNPILLFIHGGPGIAFMPIAGAFQGSWEKYFTVVQWDQRGAGKTYTSNSKELQRSTMNMQRMNADTVEVVNYLRDRFKRDKIFVLGHSWGTVLGLQLAHDHPELLYAYVGVGEVINMRQNEEAGYKDTLEKARDSHNEDAIRELTRIAPYPSTTIELHKIRIIREWENTLLGPSESDESFLSAKAILAAPEYSLINDIDWFRGQLFSIGVLLPELMKVDLNQLGYDFRVPIFFLEGRHDPFTSSILAREYFDQINAPEKQFVWFEKSGHFPFAEEPREFTDALVQRILPLAPQAASSNGP